MFQIRNLSRWRLSYRNLGSSWSLLSISTDWSTYHTRSWDLLVHTISQDLRSICSNKFWLLGIIGHFDLRIWYHSSSRSLHHMRYVNFAYRSLSNRWVSQAITLFSTHAIRACASADGAIFGTEGARLAAGDELRGVAEGEIRIGIRFLLLSEGAQLLVNCPSLLRPQRAWAMLTNLYRLLSLIFLLICLPHLISICLRPPRDF